MEMTVIPRALVRRTIQVCRLPLSAAEAAARTVGADPAGWPTTLAAESLEAEAKRVAGAVLHDELLADEGRVQQAKVTELRRSRQLRTAAAETRREGAAEARQRRQEVDAQREAVTEAATQQAADIDRATRQRLDRAARDGAERAEVAAEVSEERQQAVAAADRQARAVRIEEESAALDTREAALADERRAERLRASAERKRQARKTS